MPQSIAENASPYDRGQKLFDTDRFDEAAEQFSLALIENPENVDALRKRSDCRFFLADFRGAADDLETALQIAPSDFRLYLERNTLRTTLDNTHDGWEDLETACRLAPDQLDVHLGAAAYWTQRCNEKKAAPAIERILSLAPENAYALSFKASFLMWNGRSQEAAGLDDRAVKAYEKQIQSGPLPYDELDHYAYLLVDAGRDKEALAAIREGMSRFPKLEQFRFARARYRYCRENLAAAQSDLNKVGAFFQEHSIRSMEFDLLQIDLWNRTGKTDDALLSLETHLRSYPYNAAAVQRKLLIQIEQADISDHPSLRKITETADRLAELTPGYFYPYLYRHWLEFLLGDEEAAEADYVRTIELLHDLMDRFDACYYLLDTRHYDAVREIAEKVLEDEPYDTNAVGLLGAVANQTGDFRLALKEFTIALEQEEPTDWLLAETGRAHLGLGKQGPSRYHLQEAIRFFSAVIEMPQQYADCYRYRAEAVFRLADLVWFGKKKLLKQALEDSTESLRLNPTDVEALFLHGEVTLRLKMFE